MTTRMVAFLDDIKEEGLKEKAKSNLEEHIQEEIEHPLWSEYREIAQILGSIILVGCIVGGVIYTLC